MSIRAQSYDRIAAAYDLVADPAEHKARDRGLDLLDARPGERVLEIGTGTGGALARLAQAVGPGGEVCGLDASAGMLQVARRRMGSLPADVQLHRGDARCLPFRAAVFDAAFIAFTLELFEPNDIDLVLTEIERVLRPQGRLAVVCLNLVPEPGIVSQVYVWLHHQFPHLIDCQPIDVLRHLERNGYRSVLMESIGLWGLPVAVLTATPMRVDPHSRSRRGI